MRIYHGQCDCDWLKFTYAKQQVCQQILAYVAASILIPNYLGPLKWRASCQCLLQSKIAHDKRHTVIGSGSEAPCNSHAVMGLC